MWTLLAWLTSALVLLLLVGAVASVIATARFRDRCRRELDDVLSRGRLSAPASVDTALIGRLPAPVRRYVETAGPLRPFRVAVLDQVGALRATRDAAWMPFEATQAYSLEPPGFVWLARARIAPMVDVLARDRFVDGRGQMLVRALGWITVANASGRETDHSAGLRHWGEVLAFPESVLDPRMRWEPIDDRHARCTVVQDGNDLQADVEFDDRGFPAVFRTQRYRDVGGHAVLTPWSGRMSEWRSFGGRMFPARWESVWHLDGGDFLAVRMENRQVTTDQVTTE